MKIFLNETHGHREDVDGVNKNTNIESWRSKGGLGFVYTFLLLFVWWASLAFSAGNIPSVYADENINNSDPVYAVDFKGCSEVWIVFEEGEPEDSLGASVKVFNSDSYQVEYVSIVINESDTKTISGHYGLKPVFKFNVHDYFNRSESEDDKILGVKIEGGSLVENNNNCAYIPSLPEPEILTVHAHKIVCEDANEMPGYANGGPNIDNETAVNWVKENDSCKLVKGWEFQWAPEGTSNPGDTLYGEAGDPWKTFGPTDSDGKATLYLTADDIEGMNYIWVREVLKEGYILFTYGPNKKSNSDSHSAEMYCYNDVFNYDNYDKVDGVAVGNTYYCVAWNMAEEEVPEYECLLPDNLKDDKKVSFGKSYGKNEKTVQEILDSKGYDLNAYKDQKNYQVWHSDSSTVVKMTIEFLAAYAGNSNVFGYYINGDLDTFEPLFKNKSHSDFLETPIASTGHSISIEVYGAEKIGFAIHTERVGGKDVWTTETRLNVDGERHAVVYEGKGTEEYVLGFEDLYNLGDADYNDMMVKVIVDECPLSESVIPTVTLEADPIKVYKGDETTLTWDSDDAETCYSDDFETHGATSGTTTLTIESDTTFTVTCESSTRDEASDSVDVTVKDPVDPYSPSVTIIAKPTKIDEGEDTTLEWSSSEVVSCYGVNFDTGEKTFGTTTVSNLKKTTKFEIFCEGKDESQVSDSATVTVEKAPAPKPRPRPSPRPPTGFSPVYWLIISNEGITDISNTSVMIGWRTNIEASTQVVYGTESVDFQDIDMKTHAFGYEKVTDELKNDLVLHYMGIGDLTPGETYYFRPVSQAGGEVAVGKELVFEMSEEETPTLPECRYLEDYLRIDFDNDPIEVYKLQVFLNEYENISTPVNGIFDQATFDSVVVFQERYFDTVLKPWGHTAGTGYVYITTKNLINEIVCEREIPLSVDEAIEIGQYRAFIGELAQLGIERPLTLEEMQIIEEEYGGDIYRFIKDRDERERKRKDEDKVDDFEGIIIGLDGDVDDDKIGFSLLAGVIFPTVEFPGSLSEFARLLFILILVVLLIYLLALLFTPASFFDTEEAKNKTAFRRSMLFTVFVFIALVASVVMSFGTLIIPLIAVFVISLMIMFSRVSMGSGPVNQELDLDK